MKQLTIFRVWTRTKWGVGCFDIRAKSIEDTLSRISKTDKKRCTSIECLETSEQKTIEEILGLELT